MLSDHDMVMKAWDTYQGLIKGMNENCLKVRSLFLSITTAIIAYAYVSGSMTLYLLNIFVIPLFCFWEAGYRVLQSQYIEKTKSIEKTINDILASEEHPSYPDEGICTSLNTPSFKGLVSQFKFKRILFWLPYVIVFFISLILLLFNITKSDVKNDDLYHVFYLIL